MILALLRGKKKKKETTEMAPAERYNEKLDIVTQEVVICKLLTSNDQKVRRRGLKSLKKWFRDIGEKKGNPFFRYS